MYRVSSKGTIGLGATFGFATGANHYYFIIGWNNTKFSVAPRFNSMRLNEFNLGESGAASDSTTMVKIKSATGNVSGVNFGFGFDRQITPGFSLGFRMMVLNAGGSKAIRLPSANYVPNGGVYDRPFITVRPFVMTSVVVLKYVFMPKKK